MPLSAGVFTRLYNWIAERDAGDPRYHIFAAKMDDQEEDIGTAIETALMRDGQNAASASIPMGGFLFTNVGAATARTNFLRVSEFQDGGHVWIAGGGTADVITATYAPALTALTNGCHLRFRATAANATTTPTFAPNGLTAKTIVKGSNTALVAGDIAGASHECIVQYNSTTDKWHLLNPIVPFAAGTTVVNNGGTPEVALPRNAQTGTTYTILTGDRGKHVTFSNGSAVAVTLPQAGAAGFLLSWFCYVENLGAGAATITPTTSTINGAATLVLTFGAAQAYLITSDGTNYRALPMYTPAASAIDLNALTTDATGGATGDFIPFVDISDANASNKVTAADFVYNIANNLTADTAPDMAADHVITRDNSASAAKKVLLRYIGAGKQTVWIPAAAMTSRTTNGAASGTTESTTNKVMNKTLDFDTTTQEFAQFTVAFPKGWDEGAVTFVPYWTAASGSGTFISTLAGVALSDDDAIDTAFGTAQSSSDTLITALDVHVGAESSAITIAGTPAEGDLVYFQIARDVADTLGVDAKLIGIKLFYTTNSTTDE